MTAPTFCLPRGLIALLGLLALLSLTACGDAQKPVNPNPPAKTRLLIVSTTPVLHEMVSALMEDRADTHCLLSGASELRHGDLAAEDVPLLRDADVVIVHHAEPFPFLLKTIEANVPADRVLRVGMGSKPGAASDGSHAFSLSPKAVLAMLGEVETHLIAVDPKHQVAIEKRAASMRASLEEFDAWRESRVISFKVLQRVIATDDEAVARVIRAIGFDAVLIPGVNRMHPTVADREAIIEKLLNSNATAIAISTKDSETFHEMILGIGKDTALRVITTELPSWPAPDETYVKWMRANVESMIPMLPNP